MQPVLSVLALVFLAAVALSGAQKERPAPGRGLRGGLFGPKPVKARVGRGSPGDAPLPSKSRKALLKALEEPIDADFADVPLTDVLTFIEDLKGINVMLDYDSLPKDKTGVTVKLKKVPLRKALTIILILKNMDYIIDNNTVLVSHAQRLITLQKALRESDEKHDPNRRGLTEDEKALCTKLAQQIKTVDFQKAPLADVISFIRDISGVNIVLDTASLRTRRSRTRRFPAGMLDGPMMGPDMGVGMPGDFGRPPTTGRSKTPKDPAKTIKVTLKLRQVVPIRKVLQYVLLPKGLDFVVDGNVVIISTRERLNHIRDRLKGVTRTDKKSRSSSRRLPRDEEGPGYMHEDVFMDPAKR